ncbi:MAG: sensor domain-containing diguanylate cyclase [Desulfuromonas sp.]|nr:sensor domain-containing diguanylate cyclase [Desulfuromonas sp.]
MRHDKSLFERVRENEQQAEKFYQVELKILATLNFADFFETLLAEISQVFEVPFVWFSLIADTELASLLQEKQRSASKDARINLVDRHQLQQFIGYDGNEDDDGQGGEVLLVNENIQRYLPLLPRDQYYAVRSIALTPIFLDGELIGTLNQADVDPQRFAPGLCTMLLERLALKLSICVSNVTAHEKLQCLAFLDPLTGLFNRRVMEQTLDREFHRAQRYAAPLSLVFIDLNDFKKVNDTHGHHVGDLLLQHIADQLRALSRVCDLVARFAGDEFILILPQTDKSQALTLMQRMQKDLQRVPLAHADTLLPIALSYGIASLPDTEVLSPQQLVKKADQELYTHKRRNKVRAVASFK